jgi:hypothetical protein
MRWAPPASARIVGFLLSLCAGLALGRAAPAAGARDLGILGPFYRATQLQGHLIGMGLMEVPAYLTASHIDLKYRAKPGTSREIPFADSFTINRFLGGYRDDWLQKFHQWDDRLGRRSLDYAIRRSDGSWQFRPDLIRRRLEPYLAAGYRSRDITIALENVPWDLATPDRRPPEMGPWGRRTPPGDIEEWSLVIRQFATDLAAYLGGEASAIQFETGVEYDEKASFDGTADEFFRYYEATDRALHSVLPDAALSPGEFTGLGTCAPNMPHCVSDTGEFLEVAARDHLRIADVPRSLHSFLDKPANLSPSMTAERAIRSYARLPQTVPEVHQFGLLNEPFGNEGSDTAALRANWEFQVLLRLWEALRPRRVFHWGGFDTVGRMALLNGSGFLRLVLDRYIGSHAYLISPREEGAAGPGSAELLALGLTDGAKSAVIVSSFSPHASGAARPVDVELPSGMLDGGRPLKSIRYRQSSNVQARIRADLAADNNLRPDFADCALCLATPIQMARDGDRARAMLTRNWENYVEVMKDNLRWRTEDRGISRDGRVLRVTLEPDELVLIE